jgi:hypothetical protein
MPFAESHNLLERCNVPIHTENRFRNNQFSAGRRRFPELTLQVVHVAVGKNYNLCPRQPASIDDACVVQGITKNNISLFNQGGKETDIGLEAGVENQSRLGSLEPGDSFFQLQVKRHVAGDKTGSPGATSIGINGVLGCGPKCGVIGETQVVIGREVQDLLAVEND